MEDYLYFTATKSQRKFGERIAVYLTVAVMLLLFPLIFVIFQATAWAWHFEKKLRRRHGKPVRKGETLDA